MEEFLYFVYCKFQVALALSVERRGLHAHGLCNSAQFESAMSAIIAKRRIVKHLFSPPFFLVAFMQHHSTIYIAHCQHLFATFMLLFCIGCVIVFLEENGIWKSMN